MALTSAMIVAAGGYIVNKIAKSKGAKQASDEMSTEIWKWILPIFLKSDKKLVEDAEKDSQNMKTILEYNIKRMAEKDESFDSKLVELLKKTDKKGIKGGTTITQTNVYGNNIGRDKHSK